MLVSSSVPPWSISIWHLLLFPNHFQHIKSVVATGIAALEAEAALLTGKVGRNLEGDDVYIGFIPPLHSQKLTWIPKMMVWKR